MGVQQPLMVMVALGGLDGTRPLNSVECFDVHTLAWQDMPVMVCPRYAGIASTQSQRIFAMFGELTDAGRKASIERDNRTKGLWELLPSVQQPHCGAATMLAASGCVALTLGGLSLSGQALNVSRRIGLEGLMTSNSEDDEDEDDSPRWTCLPPMPTPRHMASATSYDGGAVAIGGKGSTFEVVQNVEFFNPDNWNWEVLPPLQSPRLRAAVVGGHL